MRNSRLNEAQIVVIIGERDVWILITNVYCLLGLSKDAFEKLKSKYGNKEVSSAAKLRTVTDKDAKLNRPLTKTMLDNFVPKDMLERTKNGV